MIRKLVRPIQSAFTPSKYLMDSLVATGKIVVAWGRKGTRGVMWKVDFAKAFDSFYWDFLWLSMRRRGFLVEWITWVSRFIASHSFLGLMNGCSEGGWIQLLRQGGRVRQGCLLAPLLFVLEVDALSMCKTQGCSQGMLRGY